MNGSTTVLKTRADRDTSSLYLAVKRSAVDTSTPTHSNLSGDEVFIDRLQQICEALCIDTGTHHNRNDVLTYVLAQRPRSLPCKFLTGEVTLHVLLTGLCHCLDQRITDDAEVLLGVLRNLAFSYSLK